MSKVLNITERLQCKKHQEQAEAYRQQVETIHRIVQCTSCRFRCAMCGQHLSHEGTECPADTDSGITLCTGCRTEFESYLEMNREKESGGVLWRNEEWVRLWSTWWEFQEAVRQFRVSPEYKQLLEEPEG